MSEIEGMVSQSQASRMLTTGLEWQAGLFVETYIELSTRFGRDVAKEVLARAMYRAGIELGREGRALVDTAGPAGIARVWDLIYGMGTKQAEQLSDDRFVIRGTNCVAFNLFRRRGLSEEEIRFVCDAFCGGDVGHAKGFDDQMNFQHASRMMRGDDCCTWVFTTSPQEPSDAALSPAL